MITFTLDGEPVPWARARRNGSVYFMEPKARQYHNAIAYAGKVAMEGRKPLAEAAVVTVEAVLPIRQSWPKRSQEYALQGLKRPTGRPDVDNYAKIVMDALNGIVWKDDSQVVELRASKRYGEAPYLKVTVE